MSNLVIVESPVKAKALQNYLGNSYNVLASYGHIRDLTKRTWKDKNSNNGYKIDLNSKAVDLNWAVNCNGIYDFYGTQFKCWKEEGHGVVNLQNAIQKSCNIYFYNLMQKIDFNLWSQEALKFGFGKRIGIDLPYEKEGLIHNKIYMNNTYKYIYIYNVYGGNRV